VASGTIRPISQALTFINGTTNPSTLAPGVYYAASPTYNASYWPQNLYGTIIVFQGKYNRTALFIGHQHTYSAYMEGNSTVLSSITWRRLDN